MRCVVYFLGTKRLGGGITTKIRLKKNLMSFNKEEVQRLLSSFDIQRCKRTHYYVQVNERWLPVKEALEKVMQTYGINLSSSSFTTRDAVRFFRQLGFEVKKIEKIEGTQTQKKKLEKFIGVLDLEGNALGEKKKLYT